MIDPSPDWIVGVSSLELCLRNCSWVESKILNLYPWDAGTDDGITYIVRKTILTDVTQKRITNEGFGSLKAIKELPDPFRSVFNVDFVDFNLNNPRYQ
jgi:hypothetical protein